ncbi:MAG TPA: MDR family MFS transporter [Candidatus Bathyarchaeia archaeon]|nr:MDR family MFS transporter [Candidatus Bathyarchaeia archaeon]
MAATREPRRGVVLAGVMGSVFLAAMESTVVATAMPTVIASLGGIEIYSWTFSAFLLASTVTMPLWGRLADQLGRRGVYLAGLSLFLIGSALSGLSQSMAQLITFRAIQGLGAGSLVTIGMTIIADLWGLERRAKMQGYFSSVYGVASVAGPLVGGFLTDTISWRWVFYINLPFGLLAMVAIGVGLGGERIAKRGLSFDYLGTAVFTAAISALLVGLVEAGRGASWMRAEVLGLIALAAALLAVFVRIERAAAEPVVPLALFAIPMVRAAAVTGFLSGMAMFGTIPYVPLFLQAVIGSNATQAGFVLMPFVIGWVACSILGARLVLRVSYRVVVLMGMLALTLAFVFLSGWNDALTRGAAMRDMALAGIGMGLVFVPMLIAVQSAVPRAVLGSATSVTGFFRFIGGAVGVAVMGSVLAHRLHRDLALLLQTAPATALDGLREVAAHPDLIVNPLTRAARSPEVLALLRPTMAHAVGGVFVVGLVVAVAALASAFLVPPGQARDLAVTQEPVAPSGS